MIPLLSFNKKLSGQIKGQTKNMLLDQSKFICEKGARISENIFLSWLLYRQGQQKESKNILRTDENLELKVMHCTISTLLVHHVFALFCQF